MSKCLLRPQQSLAAERVQFIKGAKKIKTCTTARMQAGCLPQPQPTPTGTVRSHSSAPSHSPEPRQQAPPLLAGRPAPHKGVELVPGHAQGSKVVWLDSIDGPVQPQLPSLVKQQVRGTCLRRNEARYDGRWQAHKRTSKHSMAAKDGSRCLTCTSM